MYKIYGHEKHKPYIKTDLVLLPACIVKYNVEFNTYTSIGIIDEYSNNGEFYIDGVTNNSHDLHESSPDSYRL